MGSAALTINAVADWSSEDGSSCGELGFSTLPIATGTEGTAGSWLGLGLSGAATGGVCNAGKHLSIPAAGTVGDSNALTALFGRAIPFAGNSRTQHGAAVAED